LALAAGVLGDIAPHGAPSLQMDECKMCGACGRVTVAVWAVMMLEHPFITGNTAAACFLLAADFCSHLFVVLVPLFSHLERTLERF
jgi:hypothetical protein